MKSLILGRLGLNLLIFTNVIMLIQIYQFKCLCDAFRIIIMCNLLYIVLII